MNRISTDASREMATVVGAPGNPSLFDSVDFCDSFRLIAGAGVHHRWWTLRGFIDVGEAS